MTLTSLVALISLLPGQAPEPTVRLAGREVPLRFPIATADAKPTEEFVNWHGWTYARSGGREVGNSFVAPRDWRAVIDALALPYDKGAPWRVKFVIFRSVNVLDSRADGSVSQRRSALEPSQVDETLQSIARLDALVIAESKGKIRLVSDVEIEDQPIYLGASKDRNPFEGFLEEYFAARLNGGGYDADDRLFRGPYHSVFCIHPALTLAHEDRMILKSPAHTLSVFGQFATAPGTLELRLYGRLFNDMQALARESGMHSIPEHEVSGLTGTAVLQRAAAEDELQDLATKIPISESVVSWPDSGSFPSSLLAPAYKSPNVSASLVADPERGSVLSYTEKGLTRSGGLTGVVANIALADTPYLSFWVKSKTKEPLAITVSDGKARATVSMGEDRPAPVEAPAGDRCISAAFVADGTWQHVVANLASSGLGTGPLTLVIGPSANALQSERALIEPIAYQFDKFEFLKAADAGAETLATAISAGFDSPTPQARIQALLGLSKTPSDPDKAQAIKLLQDLNDDVRLNATVAVGEYKDADAESALTANATNLDPRIDEAALFALAKLDTPTAWETIRHALLSGTTDLSKMTAARLLASRKDASLAGPLSVLLAQRNWTVRRAAAEAIGSLSSKEASIILMAFLQEVDPAVRLAATKAADTSQEYVCNKLLYSAVNDPSDAVRAWSNIKLIQSPIASFKKEGYKGVRDDGRAARKILLQQLVSNPSEEHRQALRLAVADTDVEVRALALQAFAAMPGQVSVDEVANTFQDHNPVVQAALVELAIGKKLLLPRETVAVLQASTDANVAKRAKELGG